MTRAEVEVIEAAQAFTKAWAERERDDWDEPDMGPYRPVRHHLAAGARREPPCVYCTGYLDAEKRLVVAVEALPFHWQPKVEA